ncbi:MAG: YfhO family protein [Saprospiraceae bacterium]|nr:YfhO family protein [Saprospiraceae bacterium]
MSKSKPRPVAPKTIKQSPAASQTSTPINSWMAHALSIAGFLVLCCIFFFPQLEGKKVMQTDILGWEGMAQEALSYEEKTGEMTLWTNSMFSGMPTYQINNFQPNNMTQYVQKLAGFFFSEPIGLFLASSIWAYILLLVAGSRPLIAFMGAFAFAFTSYNVILYEAGHVLKLQSISTFPPIIAGLYLIFKRKLIPGGVLFALGMALALYANHVQMTYYLGIILGLFFLVEIIRMVRQKEWKLVVNTGLILIAGIVLALGSSASKMWTTSEYVSDTMRGEPILPNSDPASSSSTNGLAWDYAMQWSQGGLETFTVMIPGVVGGSSAEKIGAGSATFKELRARGMNVPEDLKLPLYWGKLPFTSGPVYFGGIVVFLFVLGMILLKGPMKWWILAGVLFTFIFAMGKNAEGINRLIFDYLPLMNKFRSPNSVTAVTPVFMILLGSIVLQQILSGAFELEKAKKAIYWAAGSLAAVCLFFIALGPSMFDFTSSGDARMVEMGVKLDTILEDRKSLMRADAFRALVIIGLGAGLIWMYLADKLKSNVVLIALAAITVIDIWTVDKRYLSGSDFVTESEYKAYYNPRPVDEAILKDPDPNYRVMDLSDNTFQSSFASYFHKSIGGYHAAKFQRYQDIIDRHISQNNTVVIDMLNTKYIISGEGENITYQQNPNAKGNAWFVKEIKPAASAEEEINALSEGFDPVQTAVVHADFSAYPSAASFTGEGSIRLTSYKPNELIYESESASGQFATFSEIWYGPDKGWQAYVDGNPVEHIRVNYILRGMNVPEGKHTITFKFEPKSHATGETISLISSLLLLLAVGGMVYMFYHEKKGTLRPQKDTNA